MVAELRGLRKDVAALQASSERGNIQTSKVASALNGQGQPILVTIA